MNSTLLRRVVLLLLAAAGLVQCWRYRHFMYPDGIQYVDMARLALSHHPGWLINGYWSPLYPALLAGAFWLLRPSAYWMYPVVQLVNALCSLAAIAAFDLLLRTILRQRSAGDGDTRFSDAEVIVVSGACAFAYLTYLINVRTMTPDMLVAAATLAAAACLVRASSGGAGLQPCPATTKRAWMHAGLALALGYYAKAAMFPVALMVSAIMLIRSRGRAAGVRGPALMLGAFLVAALPLVVALTMKSGHPTFGESGRINYGWYVNRWGTDLHWHGEPAESGRPVHPMTRIAEHPPAFEFQFPVPVTYAPFFDPPFWTRGMRVAFSPARQAAAFKRTAGELGDVIVDLLPILFPLAAVSLLSTRQTGAALARHAPALWLTLTPMAVYLPVHIEGRFIGASLLIASMVLVASLHVRESRGRRFRGVPSLTGATTAVAAVGALLIAGPVAAGAVRQTGLDVLYSESRQLSRAWRVAQALHQLGVPDDADVAAIGANLGADWAQIARVHIVAEIGPAGRPAFLAAAPEIRRAVIRRLTADGARALVIDAPAASVDPDAIDLEETGFSVVRARQRMERYARRDDHVQ